MTDYGKRIKEIRKQRGMSAEELAEKIGVAPATIYRYENGSISSMTTDKLLPIADALGVTPAALMGWTSPAYLIHGADTPLDPQIPETKQQYETIGVGARTVRPPRPAAKKKTELDEIIDRLIKYQDGTVMSPDEQRLINLFRSMTPKQQEKTFKIIDTVLDD